MVFLSLCNPLDYPLGAGSFGSPLRSSDPCTTLDHGHMASALSPKSRFFAYSIYLSCPITGSWGSFAARIDPPSHPTSGTPHSRFSVRLILTFGSSTASPLFVFCYRLFPHFVTCLFPLFFDVSFPPLDGPRC